MNEVHAPCGDNRGKMTLGSSWQTLAPTGSLLCSLNKTQEALFSHYFLKSHSTWVLSLPLSSQALSLVYPQVCVLPLIWSIFFICNLYHNYYKVLSPLV